MYIFSYLCGATQKLAFFLFSCCFPPPFFFFRVRAIHRISLSLLSLCLRPFWRSPTTAAEEAAAKSAAASASVAAEGAAQAEENSLVEALREVHGALMTVQEDGAEVERVAAGVGLAPALLGSLRALKRRGDDGGGGGGGGSESGWRLAKEVSWIRAALGVVLCALLVLHALILLTGGVAFGYRAARPSSGRAQGATASSRWFLPYTAGQFCREIDACALFSLLGGRPVVFGALLVVHTSTMATLLRNVDLFRT